MGVGVCAFEAAPDPECCPRTKLRVRAGKTRRREGEKDETLHTPSLTHKLNLSHPSSLPPFCTHTHAHMHTAHRSHPFTQPVGKCDFNEPVLNGH